MLKNSVAVNTSYYSLVKDTGILKNSTRASDKIVLTSTGLINIYEQCDIMQDMIVALHEENLIPNLIGDINLFKNSNNIKE
jgi:hypothetical protein